MLGMNAELRAPRQLRCIPSVEGSTLVTALSIAVMEYNLEGAQGDEALQALSRHL